MKKDLLFFVVFMMFSVVNAEIANGSCGKNGNNATWTISDDFTLTIEGAGEMQDYDQDYNVPWYNYSREIVHIQISNGITSLGDNSFSDCSSVSILKIPNSVTRIGVWTFKRCESITSVIIPNSVVIIDGGAFEGCNSLSSITIGNSVTTIGLEAFKYCRSLTYVQIPNSVISIGNKAFYECNNLKYIDIPNSVTSIGNSAFAFCYNLTSVVIPNSVKSIGKNIFDNCRGLTTVKIGNSVTSIEKNAFYHCYNLTSITIGESIETIDSSAFTGCIKLGEVICHATKVPKVNSELFNNTLAINGTLYVPKESLTEYRLAKGWREWKFIEPISNTNIAPNKMIIPTENTIILSVSNGTMNIDNAPINELIMIYNIDGELYETVRVKQKLTSIHLSRNTIYIIKVGKKSFKVKI